LRAEAGAGLEILSHDIKAGAGINGIAGIKAYAEATPVIGYREKAVEGQDMKGEWFVRGDLELAAQPFLGLSGDLFVEISTPWWSPLSDHRWTWPLFSKEWPLGSSMGMLVSVDYVFGSGQWPKFDLKPVEFDSNKFVTGLYEDSAKSGPGKELQQKGKWQEKNSAAAQPPPKGTQTGSAKPGKLDSGKAKTKQAKAKKLDKAVDPNAKTKEGKSVKQLQADAQKKGKGPQPKTAAADGKADATKVAKKGAKDERTEKDKANALTSALAEAKEVIRKPNVKEKDARKQIKAIKNTYKLTALDLVVDKKSKGRETVHVHGKINPEGDTPASEIKEGGDDDELAKVRRESHDAWSSIDTKLKTELGWNTQQQHKANEALRTVPTNERRVIAELKAQLDTHKRSIDPFVSEIENLLKTWQGAEKAGNDAELRELAIDEFKKVKGEAERISKAINAIKRPGEGTTAATKTKPWPHGSITKLPRRVIANHQVEVHVDERGPHVHLDRGTAAEQYVNLRDVASASDAAGLLPAGVGTDGSVLAAMQGAIDTWKKETGG
jgi:hypothetical protein